MVGPMKNLTRPVACVSEGENYVKIYKRKSRIFFENRKAEIEGVVNPVGN